VHSTNRRGGEKAREKAREKAGKIRIIAGHWRGRKLAVPDRPGLRPTGDRVRETLFNWLGQWLDGKACLDVYAGSGALGFEAASRGASRVVMVENDGGAFAALEAAKDALQAQAVALHFGDALEYLRRCDERFDVVFLDPPFGQNALAPVLERLPALLAPGGRVYVEADAPVDGGDAWREVRRARAGQVSYQLLEKP
jgi:16S rRNA (guanine966-N2)-methyltransferase